MNCRHFSFTFLGLLLCLLSYGQDHYDINDYRRSLLKRSYLTFDGSLSEEYVDAHPFVEDDNTIKASISGKYGQYYNTNKHQRNIKIYSKISYSEENPFLWYYNMDYEQRSYLGKRDAWHWVYGGSVITGFDIHDNKNFYISPKAGYGYGRIELINDAWNAYGILGDLRKRGLISEEDYDIEAIAHVIGKVRNMRSVDPRLENIAELTALGDDLLALGVIDDFSPEIAAVLYDSYAYENFYQRQTGWLLEAYTRMDTKLYEANTYSNLNEYRLGLEYMYHRALGLKHQISAGIINEYIGDYVDSSFKRNSFSVNMNYGWLPNRRTKAICHASLSRLWEPNSSKANLLHVGARFSYYISPQTQFYFSFRSFLLGYDINTRSNLNAYMGLTHALR